MKETIISNNEREFIKSAVKQNVRIDGRHAYEYRNLDISFGSEYGNSVVNLGNTRVMAQVSCKIVTPHLSRPAEGLLFVNVELSPMAAPEFEPGRPSEIAVEIGRIVERCVRDSRCVDLESLCIVTGKQVWQIRLDVHVLNHDGNMTDCASVAAVVALMHFRRPDVTVSGEDVIVHPVESRDPVTLSIHHIPICVSFAFFDNGKHLLLDPTEREECVMEGKMILGMNSHKEICTLHMGGTMLLVKDQVLRCAEVAAIRANEITDIIKKSLTADKKERASGTVVQFSDVIKKNRITVNRLPTTCVEFSNVKEEIDRPTDMDLEEEPKVVIRGPGTAQIGDGGRNAWGVVSDDDGDDEDNVTMTNDKEDASESILDDGDDSDEGIVTLHSKDLDYPSVSEDITTCAQEDVSMTVDLTKALKTKKKKVNKRR